MTRRACCISLLLAFALTLVLSAVPGASAGEATTALMKATLIEQIARLQMLPGFEPAAVNTSLKTALELNAGMSNDLLSVYEATPGSGSAISKAQLKRSPSGRPLTAELLILELNSDLNLSIAELVKALNSPIDEMFIVRPPEAPDTVPVYHVWKTGNLHVSAGSTGPGNTVTSLVFERLLTGGK
jgi:hypothetical protein